MCKARGWRKVFTLLHYYELKLEGKMLHLKCSGCSTKTKFFLTFQLMVSHEAKGKRAFKNHKDQIQ